MNLLLVGPRGIGKTTVAGRLVERLTANGMAVGGFVTEVLVEKGHRAGWRLRSVASGDSKIVAHGSLVSNLRVEGCGVDVEMVNYVVDTTLRPSQVDVMIIDEVAPLQCLSQRFHKHVRRLFDEATAVVACLTLDSCELAGELLARDDVERLDVTVDNREVLAEEVHRRLTSAASRR